MNIKRTQSEYELLFTKKNEKDKPLSDTEIAKILNVSRISVYKARKKWSAKSLLTKEYEVVEDKGELKEITLPVDTFENLFSKALESTSILQNEENKAKINYFSTFNSLSTKLKELNRLKEEDKDTSKLEFSVNNDINMLDKLKDYLFQAKLEFKKRNT